jgi:diguanylate cyclase (GGDEF)-like protein
VARRPLTRSLALHTLRVQVSLALLVAAALCAVAANKTSSDELAGAYRETGDEVLATVTSSFVASFDASLLSRPAALDRRVEELRDLHPQLRWATVYRRDGDEVRAVARAGRPARPSGTEALALAAIERGRSAESELDADGSHRARRATPLRDGPRAIGALEVGFDLEPSDAALADRNRTILLVLAALLLGFTAFTFVVLDRGIFRPLDRLRTATHHIRVGDLGTRLGWSRRDEIGALAHDFDDMAVELERNHERLENLAHADPLTGLGNHRHFQELLVEEIERAGAQGTALALIVLDIDHFKRVNDARGHPFGDRLLREVGERLRRALAGIGEAARLGGDEFAVILPGADAERAHALCEAARAAVCAAPSDYELTCSAGVACYPAHARSATDLVQLADGALYWAKASGRARARMYDPEHVLVVTEEQRAEFGSLIERPSAVRPVFQPIVSLRTGEVVGYEALARFDSTRELPPSWWFAQAHRFGLGPQLEAEAVRAARAQEGRPEGTFLSVNLSPSALRSPEVRAVLDENLSGLVIEITEQEEVLHDDRWQATLAPLRGRGARIAVDDAGAGYAGLQQVMRMQADMIKLDRALISDIHVDAAKAALVRSLVLFAAETGADLCAEGIESLEELRTLAGLGVSLAQGFALARPGPAWATVRPEVAVACRRAFRPAAESLARPEPRQQRGHVIGQGRRPV